MRTVIAMLLVLVSVNAYAAPVLSAFEMDVYRFGVSKNQDCSDMQVVIDNGLVPTRVNLVNNPNFGSAYITPGTYECVALEVNRRLYITPIAAPAGIGTCTAGVQSSTYIGKNVSDADLATYLASLNFTDRTAFRNATDSVLIDKTNINFMSDILMANTQKMTIFLSTKTATSPQPEGVCPYIPPFLTNPWCGISITQPLVVSANSVGKFITRIVNPATAIDNSVAGECNLQDIEFDFQ